MGWMRTWSAAFTVRVPSPETVSLIEAQEQDCFCPTRRMNATPMPGNLRAAYLDLAVSAVAQAAADEQGPVMVSTLLTPDLDPRLDTYDRRLLLQWVWALIAHFALQNEARVKVVVQKAEKFGGLPISVAGLMRNIEGDRALSIDEWGGEQVVRERIATDEIGAAAVEQQDDVFLVVCPTNTTGASVVQDVMDLVDESARQRPDTYRPVILINPRLDDVPSHSNIMSVQGRSARAGFVDSAFCPHIFRLLYSAGTWYPIRGALTRNYPGPFCVWRHASDPKDDNYTLVAKLDCENVPSAEQLNQAFKSNPKKSTRSSSERQTDNERSAQLSLGALMAMAVLGLVVFCQQNSQSLKLLLPKL